jgi:hypothetical protein
MVWFALLRKISVQTVELYNLNRDRVRAFKKKSRKTVKKVRYAARSTKKVPRGKRYDTVRTRKIDKFGLPTVLTNLDVFKIIPRVTLKKNIKIY